MYEVVDMDDTDRIIDFLREFRLNVLIHLITLVDAEELVHGLD